MVKKIKSVKNPDLLTLKDNKALWNLPKTRRYGYRNLHKINRYGILAPAKDRITLRSDNGLVFTSRHDTKTVYRYGLKQAFIRPHTPQQNGMVERLIRTVKEQCIWLHNFKSLDEARYIIGQWFCYYNEQRPHQALGMKTPSAIFKLVA